MSTTDLKNSKTRKKKSYGKYFLIGSLLVIADQITKYLSQTYRKDFGILEFTYLENTGTMFGLFQNNNWFFVLFSIIAIVALYYYREEFKDQPLFLMFIISGIIGNFIDRLFRGYVIDFINFKIWPVFNLADTYLVIGVFGFIILTIYTDYKKN